MTLLTLVNDVCAAVGVHQTTSVVANINANRTMFEMLALANEMAQRIAYDTRDWQLFRAHVVLTGDGVTDSFPLPVNFKRLLLTSNVWRSTSTLYPMRFVPNNDEFLRQELANTLDSRGEWTIARGLIFIRPVMAAAVTATFLYLDKNCVGLISGGVGDKFISDDDSFRLDERLLKLGMIWQWKANKGSPYAEDMGTWGDAMANAMGHDSPGPIFIDRMPISAHARTAYPWPVPTP